MTLQVSYMGTKRSLASHVAEIIQDRPPGPMLDLFSGICAVSAAVAPDRQVWCNDIQHFAATVATAFFTSPTSPIHFDDVADEAHGIFQKNALALEDRFATQLREERRALHSESIEAIRALEHLMPYVATNTRLEQERIRRARTPSLTPYQLFTTTFSGTYFGLKQCVQVDSIRYAVDQMLESSFLDTRQHTWMCLALCQAVSKVATTTGHFAQYTRVKDSTLKRFLAQRRRSIWSEWLRAIHQISPVGTPTWRSNNRVYSSDAKALLLHLRRTGQEPAVIYADPPYTRDQYSRYYHLYETLLRYDYPTSHFTGRYRPDRFSSQYSRKTEVGPAIEGLIENAANLGSRLVLSYPERGLLPRSRETITELLRKHFGKSNFITTFDHYHSSLGGSKGMEKYPVRELIFATG